MAKRRSTQSIRSISEHLQLELDHLDVPSQEASRSESPSGNEDKAAVVLVVDDDPEMRAYVSRCLASLGDEIGEILQASDGREALALIKARRVNLVVADIVMPQIDGLELRKRVHEKTGLTTTPFLFISGSEPDLPTDTEDDIFILRKPFNSKSLGDVVIGILSNHPTIHHHKPSKEQ